MELSSQSLVDRLYNLKREAFSSLDQALSFDTNEPNSNTQKVDKSILMYEQSLDLIEKALAFYTDNKSAFVKNDICVTIHSHLISIRSQALERANKLKTIRVKNLNPKPMSTLNSEFLAAGDEILSDDFLIIDEIDTDYTLSGKDTIKNESEEKYKNFAKAKEFLRLDDGVQLFYIANDGSVSTPSYPTNMSLYLFDEEQKSDQNMVGFIRVGDWIYPLIPNESPGMKTNFNAYIFPNNDDNLAEPKFSFVGITLSDEISAEQKQFFEDVLVNISSLIYQDKISDSGTKRPQASKEEQKKKEDETEKEKSTQNSWSAERIAQSMVNGAQYLSNGLASTTDYATKYLKTGGEKLKSNMEPKAEPVSVDPRVKKVVQGVRTGTHTTVRVSSFLLNKLSNIASSAAKTVAPHIKNGSSALLNKAGIGGNSNETNSYVENVCTVANGSLQSFGIVYDSMENAAKTLAKNMSEQTVDVIDYK